MAGRWLTRRVSSLLVAQAESVLAAIQAIVPWNISLHSAMGYGNGLVHACWKNSLRLNTVCIRYSGPLGPEEDGYRPCHPKGML